MTVTEMVESLKEMMEKTNLSFEDLILQANQLESTDLGDISSRVQVILDSSDILIKQINNVIAQGEDIINVVGR
jgi:hypothetical protein